MKDKNFFIHIGAPRTGTSFLRNNVFPYIKNIYFENKLEYNNNENFPMVNFFSKMAHYGDGDELSNSVLNKIIPNIEHKKILISEEHMIWSVYHMMGNVGSRAMLLKNYCPNAKIIMTIRRQPEYFISLFKYFKTLDSSNLHRQMARIDNMINLDWEFEKILLYFKMGLPLGVEFSHRYRMYDPSDKYFDRNYRHFISADFSWLRLLKIYEYLFGKENILVLPQEMISNDIKSTLKLLSQFVGEKINPIPENLSKRANTTSQVISPFCNENQKKEFTNCVMRLNILSNRELDKELKYIDLEKYRYTDFTTTESRKLLVGLKSNKYIKLNKDQCFYFSFLSNSFKKRGFFKTIILTTIKIKNLLYGRIRLLPKFCYHHFALLKDRINSTDFEKIESIDKLCLQSENSEQYEATKIFEIKKIVKDISFREDLIAIDFGSGKGRMLCFLTKQSFVKKVWGIELSAKLVKIAKHNIKKLGVTGISILNIDAIDTPDNIIDECSLFYLYNPFPKPVFDSLIKKIEASLKRNKREAYLIYFNPVHASTIEKSSMFKRYKTYNNLISFAKTTVFKSL